MFCSLPTPDYWSESDQDEVDGSMTLKQEGPSSLCDTYHRTPSVSSADVFLIRSFESDGMFHLLKLRTHKHTHVFSNKSIRRLVMVDAANTPFCVLQSGVCYSRPLGGVIILANHMSGRRKMMLKFLF